jgi:hypothetical protein
MSASDRNWEPLVEKKRPDRLNLSAEDELELAKKHRQMRLAARELAPLLPAGGSEYGIVTTGGLALVPVLLVSLRMLRRTGCTLPVEVFLGDRTEYNEVKDVCEKVLPNLNAKCLVISDIYDTAAVDPPDHFQFKVLSILFSNFRHVLFLDADAFPAHDPTPLLRVRLSVPGDMIRSKQKSVLCVLTLHSQNPTPLTASLHGPVSTPTPLLPTSTTSPPSPFRLSHEAQSPGSSCSTKPTTPSPSC